MSTPMRRARTPKTGAGAQGAQDSGWSSLRPQGALSLNSEENDFAATLTRQPTLAEHLTGQMSLLLNEPCRAADRPAPDRHAERGRLPVGGRGSVAETLGTSVAHVEAVLARLKTCDPAGVFARDLKECLACS